MPEYGYAGEILKVNLSDGKVTKSPTAPYAEKYIGGWHDASAYDNTEFNLTASSLHDVWIPFIFNLSSVFKQNITAEQLVR